MGFKKTFPFVDFKSFCAILIYIECRFMSMLPAGV